MLLIIDNYDSFTYNLVQYFGQLGAETAVRRNDEITPDEIGALKPAAIVISPGPCSPKEDVPRIRRPLCVGSTRYCWAGLSHPRAKPERGRLPIHGCGRSRLISRLRLRRPPEPVA